MMADIIVVGASLGGLKAVQAILAKIPPGFQVPVAIVQHRQADAQDLLVGLLQRHTSIMVREAEDKEEIRPGSIYLAPTDYHLLVEPGFFALSTESPVCHARPSIDVLFESAADSYRNNVLGVVLTGAGNDGARGAVRVRRAGGTVVVQQPDTAECRDMPAAALCEVPDACTCDVEQIAAFVADVRPCKRRTGENGREGKHPAGR